MVFFVCDACGGSVKKNQVEKHLWSCKRSKSLSCIDCNVVFWGEDYKTHTKCISEDQKYGGKDYKPKVSANKGEIKQNSWIETVQSVINESNLKPHLVHVMQEILKQPNLPRKQIKFENFLKNSLRHQNPQVVNDAWTIFSKAQEKFKEQASAAKEAPPKSPTISAVKEETISLEQEPEEIENEVNGNMQTQLQNKSGIYIHSKTKKKKKKGKEIVKDTENILVTMQVNEKPMDENKEVVEEESSKKKKHKKQEKKENILEKVTDNIVVEALNSPLLVETSPIINEGSLDIKDVSVSRKKKKKSRKRKNELQVIEEETEQNKPKENDDHNDVYMKETRSINAEDSATYRKSKSKKAKTNEVADKTTIVEEILPETFVKKNKKKNKKANV